MHKIIVITLYFPLDALHVSDCISPSSGAFGICRYMPVPYVWLLYDYSQQQPDVSTYTKCDVQLIKLLLMMD